MALSIKVMGWGAELAQGPVDRSEGLGAIKVRGWGAGLAQGPSIKVRDWGAGPGLAQNIVSPPGGSERF